MAGTYVLERGHRPPRVRIAVYTAAASLLMVPLVAMQFTDEVRWTLGDFVFAGVLLGVIGGSYEFLARQAGSVAYRGASAIALLAAFLLVWINAAVGIIGDEGDDANLMFAGVLATGIGGAIIARFGAGGMARALFATVIAQVVVGVIAVAMRLGTSSPIWPREIVGLTATFAALWLVSAWLYGRAARDHAAG